MYCSDAVKEIYDGILDSVNNKRTMAPNAWTWSLIEKCQNHEDIKLLFDALQNLRRFVSLCDWSSYLNTSKNYLLTVSFLLEFIAEIIESSHS